MISLAEIPDQVCAALEELLDATPRLHRLGGMSGRLVLRARRRSRGADGMRQLIVKGRASPAEAQIYRSAAELLAEHGIPTPRLFWSREIDGEWWLMLEQIPHEFPPERWLADPEQLAILRRLHRSPLKPPGHYRPGWKAELTEAALGWFAGSERDKLSGRLEQIRRSCQTLFEPLGPISGDPNPRNWGVRDNGTLVLFDWERCTLGAPALDLAITIPGLGSPDDFARVASVYLDAGDSPYSSPDVDLLTHQLKLAKAWGLVEFLANAHRQMTDSDSEVQAIARSVAAQLSSWLTTVFGG